MKDKKYCVYIHTNKETNKKYIGMTGNSPKQRWGNGNGYSRNEEFFKDIQKYGWNDGFLHEIIFSGLSKMDARIKEKELIAYYETREEGIYNIMCRSH